MDVTIPPSMLMTATQTTIVGKSARSRDVESHRHVAPNISNKVNGILR